MEFRILGPLEVVDGGAPVPLGGAKQRALLAALLIRANEPVTTERLIDDLWGEHPPATAAHTVQVYVSNLRKLLGAERLLTRPPGYMISVEPGELDLERFERLLQEAANAPAEKAAERLGQALALWRGPALADFAYEPFAQTAIARLEELRLAAVEERIEAELACGRQAQLVGELQALIAAHPLREQLRRQLMLALYRCGRQADALAVFQETRRRLVEELGIDPSPALQRLERAILQQDRELEAQEPVPSARPGTSPERSILLAPRGGESLEVLLAFAEPLALSPPGHELVIAQALEPGGSLADATAALNERRKELSARRVSVRAAAFVSVDRASDLIRLASEQDVDLLLVDGRLAAAEDGTLADDSAVLLAEAPCDVGLVYMHSDARPGRTAVVPFGGAEHDWAALELAAWWAQAQGAELRLVGLEARGKEGGRDASRLLAHAALAVQQLTGVATEPVLAGPDERAVFEAGEDAALLVAGVADDWRRQGIGRARMAFTAGRCPFTVLVRQGLRPGGLAPRESLTRFKWSLSGVEPAAAD